MGKPPTFKVREGPYHFSPGPAAYTLRNPVDAIDALYNSANFGRARSNSKSPKNGDNSFDMYNRTDRFKLATLKNSPIPSMTLTNFLYKESGPRFGSTERT